MERTATPFTHRPSRPAPRSQSALAAVCFSVYCLTSEPKTSEKCSLSAPDSPAYARFALYCVTPCVRASTQRRARQVAAVARVVDRDALRIRGGRRGYGVAHDRALTAQLRGELERGVRALALRGAAGAGQRAACAAG